MKKLLSIILGFLLLLAIQFLCNFFLHKLNTSFPSPLLGLIVLTLLLYFKIVPESLIKDVCELLLANMNLFFIPLFVGIITYSHMIYKNLTPIVVTVVIATLITMVITAYLVDGIISLTTKDSEND